MKLTVRNRPRPEPKLLTADSTAHACGSKVFRCCGVIKGPGKGFWGDEGATLVEMALASVVLLAVFFGIIMFSFAIYAYNFVSDAAREATRYAIVRGAYCVNFADCNATQTDISNYVKSLNYPGINTANLTVTAEWYSVSLTNTANAPTFTDCGNSPTALVNGIPCDNPGNEVQVTVTYNFPLGIPFWGSGTLPLKAQSQMVISQ